MKRTVLVFIHAGPTFTRDNWKALDRALRNLVPSGTQWGHPEEDEVSPLLATIKYDQDDPRLTKIRKELTELSGRYDLSISERSKISYSSKEVLDAPYCIIELEKSAASAEDGQRKSDLDLTGACKSCWSGARLAGRFRVEPPRKRKSEPLVAGTSRGRLLVSPRLKDKLEGAGLVGVYFATVVNYNTEKELPWFVIGAERTAPPMDPSSLGFFRELKSRMGDRACETCKRDAHYHSTKEDMQARYAQSDVDAFRPDDLLNTWEVFLNTRTEGPDEKLLASPALLGSSKLIRLLLDEKIRGFKPEPIQTLSP